MADTRGYVYIIGWSRSGPVKIGRSTSPRERLKGLQVSMPHKLRIFSAIRLSNYGALEKRCHALLGAARIRGEWFDTTPARAAALLQSEAHNIDITYTLWMGSPSGDSPAIRSRDAEALSEWKYLNRG